MLGRLLESLQESVEGILGEHVHFIDDVDLVLETRRRIPHAFPEISDVVDPAIARSVDLDDIERPPCRDLLTGRSISARLLGSPFFAIEGLGEDPRHGGLPDPTGTGEDVGMRGPPGLEGIGERAGDVTLSSHLAECLRAPLERKDLIAHEKRTTIRRFLPGGNKTAVHPPLFRRCPDRTAGGSDQAIPRRPKSSAYRCYLPVLTGLAGLRRVGPDLRCSVSSLTGPRLGPREGIQPHCSGLWVTGHR